MEEKIKGFLSCRVCAEIVRDPVYLSCSHSFCHSCLYDIWRPDRPKKCPVCERKPSDDSQHVNAALKELADFYSQHRPTPGLQPTLNVSGETDLLSGQQDSQTTAKSRPSHLLLKRDHPDLEDEEHETKKRRVQQDRPDSSGHSCVSIVSHRFLDKPTDLPDNPPTEQSFQQARPASPGPSGVSFKSDRSMDPPRSFNDGRQSTEKGVTSLTWRMENMKSITYHNITVSRRVQQDIPDSPGPSFVSINSCRFLDKPTDLPDNPPTEQSFQQERPGPPGPSCVSFKSDWSMDPPQSFNDGRQSTEKGGGQPGQEHQSELASLFQLLDEDMATFLKNQLKLYQQLLSPDYPECLEAMEKQTRVPRAAVLQMTLYFLRERKQEKLADLLESNTHAEVSQRKLKHNMKEKFECLSEGVAKAGQPTLLNEIYTELYIIEGESGNVNTEHEVRQIETTSRKPAREETPIKLEDMFTPLSGQVKPIRTVMTKGVAGIGKTVLTQKFTLDWAEDKTNQDIHFTFPFTFRELNLLKGKKISMMQLLHNFITETKKAGNCSYDEFKILFILDGLDECRLPLDFHKNKVWTDITEPTSVDVLLTNLIKGNLLPSAHLWITTRPAAANQIPPECVDRVTEVRGFTDPQKEEYFRKRFRDETQASRIISHIKTARSLHIMCHIPVFCWITATVLDHVLTADQTGEMPNTLTDMYIHFLVVQSKQANVKYHGRAITDPNWNTENREIILSLGKLAFDQLEKGNLIFYEKDLAECGIDLTAASVYSGVFTQIFREECGLYQDKVFCFVHLSIQEFMAALHVFLSFVNAGVNLLSGTQTAGKQPIKTSPESSVASETEPSIQVFLQRAVDKALHSENGHLDLFLRFLLGLSLEVNQNILRGMLTQSGSISETNQETVQYIKKKISENHSPERSINLFHCLNELKDHYLVEEIQQNLRSGHLSTDRLSPGQWSALVFMLLTSEEDLDVFDLKKYTASDEGLLRLLPVVKASNRARLCVCNLSERSCEVLASILSSKSSSLRELDLSNNDLQDSGVKLLSAGLKSPHCRLEKIRLSGCLVTEAGCASLASALSNNPSHLRDLDLSYNHPGDSGRKLLSAGLEDPHWRLDTLSVDHGGEWTLKPGLMKYGSKLTLDPNTVNYYLSLSEDNKKVTYGEKKSYPDHPDRFTFYPQVLCREGLTGRCYWEVDWRGWVNIGVTYRGISRGGGGDSWLGYNDMSWVIECKDNGYIVARHNNIGTTIHVSSECRRVGVYVDWPAGCLSFYTVSSDTLTHLHTFYCTFTQPLVPGFNVWRPESSASL